MLTDELENELRSTLARTAADFESLDQARQRLLQRDYRPRRTNRRLAAGIAAGAASVAVVLSLGLSGVFGSASHQRSHPARAQLAAWTVVKRADGTVVVKIHEFRDPAGLQSRLRADGVPASVHFGTLQSDETFLDLLHFKGNPCQEYSGGEGQAQNVVTGGRPFTVGIFVHPSAIPRGAGVQIVTTSSFGYPQSSGRKSIVVWLVQASPQCTGS
jgi:hypothetical protein